MLSPFPRQGDSHSAVSKLKVNVFGTSNGVTIRGGARRDTIFQKLSKKDYFDLS